MSTGLKFVGCAVAWLCFSVSGHAQQWSSFQNGGNLSGEGWKVASQWSPESGIAWQQKLAGYGQSSPVVFGDTVYVTSVTGPQKETINIEAFSTVDGTRKWIHSQPNSTPQENNVMVSRAAPTPVADQDGVIAMFEGGNVVSLDHDGKVRWQKDLVAKYGDVSARHGLAASLEQNKTHVFVWVERSNAPYVLALLKSDGSEAWNVTGVGSTSWGSPRILKVADEEHLVLSAMGKIVGLDPESGRPLWQFEDIQGNSSSTPIPVGDGKFLVGSGGGRGSTPTKPCSGVIEIESVDGAYLPRWVWSSKKLTCSFGSPVAHDGKAYFVNRTGIVNCHDLNSGDQVFAGRLPAGQIWATPLVANEMLYFFGKGGVTSIVEAGPELKVVGENRLWAVESAEETEGGKAKDRFAGSVLYAATIAGKRLLMRRGDVLYAVENE